MHWLPGVGAAGRTSGQLGSGRPPWARPPLPSAAPEVAWQLWWRAVRTEAMGQSGSPGRTIAAGDGDGSLTSLSSGLWGPSPSRTVGQPGPPSPESPSVSTRDGRLRAVGTKCSSCQPRQPARGGGLQTRGAGKRGVRRGTGSGGSSVHTPSQASVPAQMTDRGSRSSVQPGWLTEDPGCSLSHPAASTSGRLP